MGTFDIDDLFLERLNKAKKALENACVKIDGFALKLGGNVNRNTDFEKIPEWAGEVTIHTNNIGNGYSWLACLGDSKKLRTIVGDEENQIEIQCYS